MSEHRSRGDMEGGVDGNVLHGQDPRRAASCGVLTTVTGGQNGLH